MTTSETIMIASSIEWAIRSLPEGIRWAHAVFLGLMSTAWIPRGRRDAWGLSDRFEIEADKLLGPDVVGYRSRDTVAVWRRWSGWQVEISGETRLFLGRAGRTVARRYIAGYLREIDKAGADPAMRNRIGALAVAATVDRVMAPGGHR